MTKAKKITSNKKSNNYFTTVWAGLIALLVISGVLLFANIKQFDLIGKYELLEKIDNQACRYLDNQPGVNGSFDLNANASTGAPKLIYKCFTGQTVKAEEIHGKFIDGYHLGANVSYFSSNQEAEKFAEEKINPLRYWGLDEEGQRNGIPQTSRFTFIVDDKQAPYFDAYTVKANAIVRVSLPCGGDGAAKKDYGKCQAKAEAILDRELKGINVL